MQARTIFRNPAPVPLLLARYKQLHNELCDTPVSNNVAPGVTRTDAAGNGTPTLLARDMYADNDGRRAPGKNIALLVR